MFVVCCVWCLFKECDVEENCEGKRSVLGAILWLLDMMCFFLTNLPAKYLTPKKPE